MILNNATRNPSLKIGLIFIFSVFLLSACSGGGGGGVGSSGRGDIVNPAYGKGLVSDPATNLANLSIDTRLNFDTDNNFGVQGRREMAEAVSTGLANNSLTAASNFHLTESALDVATCTNPCSHGSLVLQATRLFAGQSITSTLYDIDTTAYYNGRSISDAVANGTIAENSWINSSYSNYWGPDADGTVNVGGSIITEDDIGLDPSVIISNNVAMAYSAGNEGNDKVAQDHSRINQPIADKTLFLKQAADSGLFIFIVGLNAEQTDLHIGSSKCGSTVMNACLGINFALTLEGYNGERQGTSGSTAAATGAAWMMKTLWPSLTNKQVIQIMLTTAIDLGDVGVDERTGHGKMDFRALFQPVSTLTMPGNSGNSNQSIQRGNLSLPGLSNLNSPVAYDYFNRDFNILKSYRQIKPDFYYLGNKNSIKFNQYFGFSATSNEIKNLAIYLNDSQNILINHQGLAFCHSKSCWQFSRKNNFFGGSGTGSFKLNKTNYLSFYSKKDFNLNNWHVELGGSATYGKTKGIHLIKNLRTGLLESHILFSKTQKTRLGQTNLSFNLGYQGFIGKAEINNQNLKLKDNTFYAKTGLTWRF